MENEYKYTVTAIFHGRTLESAERPDQGRLIGALVDVSFSAPLQADQRVTIPCESPTGGDFYISGKVESLTLIARRGSNAPLATFSVRQHLDRYTFEHYTKFLTGEKGLFEHQLRWTS